MKTCSRCQTAKPITAFPLLAGKPHGARCKSCLAELRRLERASLPTPPPRLTDRSRQVKRCSKCATDKPVSEFYWNVRRYGQPCKACISAASKAKAAVRAPRPKPVKPSKLPRPSFAERFWSKVDRRGPDDCWPWRGGTTKGGYGCSASTTAHRIAYKLAVGPIPDGMEVHHTCHTEGCTLHGDCSHRRCCNPRHLQPVPPRANKQLSNHDTGPRPQRRKVACPAGHPYSAENTYYDRRGHAHCRECHRLRQNPSTTRQRRFAPKTKRSSGT